MKGKGAVLGSADSNGINSLSGNTDIETELKTTVGAIKFKTISPLFLSCLSRSEESLESEKADIGSKVGIDVPNMASYLVLDLEDYTDANILNAISKFRTCSAVRAVFPVDYPRIAAESYVQPPSDPLFAQGASWASNDYNSGAWWWNRHSIGDAWNRANRGNGARIAIVDNGFEISNHDGIPYDFTRARGYYHDWLGCHYNSDINWFSGVSGGIEPEHGTETVSLLCAAAGNSAGSAGSAPNVSVVPVKWNGDSTDLANAIDYASSSGVGARVVSISIGAGNGHSLEYDDTVRPILLNAWGRGVTCIIAAGNSSLLENFDSSKFTHSIVVGGIDRNNNRISISNYGSRVDIAAAATDMTISSVNTTNGTYTTVNNGWGTSLATPIVAGAAAMVSAAGAGWNPDAIREILIGTADIIHTDQPMSSGTGTTDGTVITRSLNAGSAVMITQAYNASNPYTVFMPAADNIAVILDQNPRIQRCAAYFPNNISYNFSGGKYIITSTGNTGGPWSAATTIFLNRRILALSATGACFQLKADGNFLSDAVNNFGPDSSASSATPVWREVSWWLP